MRKELVVELKDVDKTYRIGGIEVRALEGVSLSFAAGEFAVLVGPRGSGWATLLSIVGCLCQPSSGQVMIVGTNVTRANSEVLSELRLRKVGFLSQASNLIPNMTVLENIELALRLIEKDRGSIEGKVAEILSSVDLKRRETLVPRKLSSVEARRLAIAKSLAANPRLLVCDEPTANLEDEEADEIVDLLKKFSRERGTTVVLGTGRMDIARKGGRVVGIADGRTVPTEALSGERGNGEG